MILRIEVKSAACLWIAAVSVGMGVTLAGNAIGAREDGVARTGTGDSPAGTTDCTIRVPQLYTDLSPIAVTPRGRLAEQLRLTADGWMRDMLAKKHVIYSGRLTWERDWGKAKRWGSYDTNPAASCSAWSAISYGRIARMAPDSAVAHSYRTEWLPAFLASQQPNGGLGAGHTPAVRIPKYHLWSTEILMELMLYEYACSQDPRILEAAKRFGHLIANDYLAGDKLGEEFFTPCWEAIFHRGLIDLYGLTGDTVPVERLLAQYQVYRPRIEKSLSGPHLRTHGCSFVSLLLAPLEMYRLTGDPKDLALAVEALDGVIKRNTLISGTPCADEFMDPKNPRVSSEHCVPIMLVRAFRRFFALTGEIRYCDYAERAIYNAYMGAIDKQAHKTVAYFSLCNQLSASDWEGPYDGGGKIEWTGNYKEGKSFAYYSDDHGSPCCNPASIRAFPSLLESAVVQNAAGELALLFYGPMSYRTALPELGVIAFEESTDYPFEDEVRITVTEAPEKVLPIAFRIPTWARSAKIAINGVAQTGVLPGALYRVSRQWKVGDKVRIHFDFPIQVDSFAEAGKETAYALARGPLVFTLKVPSHQVSVHGKKSPANYAYVPDRDAVWNYALALDPDHPEASCSLVRLDVPAQSKAWQSPPVALRLKGRRVSDWHMTEPKPCAPATPAAPMTLEGETVDIDLIPFGCTYTRMTYLPVYTP